MAYALRPYQVEAVDNTMLALRERQNTIVALLTGLGKSLICAELIVKILAQSEANKVIVLTHRKELLEQNGRTLLSHYPALDGKVGIYSAGMGRRDIDKQVTFVGIQSTKAFKQGGVLLSGVTHVIVDECHRVSPTTKEYTSLFSKLPNGWKLVGLSATPYRMGEGLQDSSVNVDYFNSFFSHTSFNGVSSEFWHDCVEDGYLAPITYHTTGISIDRKLLVVDGTGKYTDDSVHTAFTRKQGDGLSLIQKQLIEMLAVAHGRRNILIFAQTRDIARTIQDSLNTVVGFDEHVVSNVYVDGDTPAEEREQHLSSFKAGDVRILINIKVFTTGFDHPELDCIAMFNATLSASEHVQMIGRGTRVADGKKDCLLIDFGNNVANNGTADSPHLPVHKEVGKRLAPLKKRVEDRVIATRATLERWGVSLESLPYIDLATLKHKLNNKEQLDAILAQLIRIEREALAAIRNEKLLAFESEAQQHYIPEGWEYGRVVGTSYTPSRSKSGNKTIECFYNIEKLRHGDVVGDTIKEWVVFSNQSWSQSLVDKWTTQRGGKRVGMSFALIKQHLHLVKQPSAIAFKEVNGFNKVHVLALHEHVQQEESTMKYYEEETI